MTRAFIMGVAGPALSPAEKRLIAATSPFGLILFRRNIESREQLAALTAEFRAAAGHDALILVDQEGGRVQRLGPPEWRRYPSAARLAAAAAALRDESLLYDVARLMAADLREVGITANCGPCLDLAFPGQSDVIGDRAYGRDPHHVAAAGEKVARGLLAGGVIPIMKHIPGHGRAKVDSHHGLPVVTASYEALLAQDFLPFTLVHTLPAAMTAHILYTALDSVHPATQSARIITDVIRGVIGFQGLLLSDDLSMQALEGPLDERAGRALAAGCDIALHCNGVMAEMEAVAAAAPELAGAALLRAHGLEIDRGGDAPIEVGPILTRLERALAALDTA